MRRRTATVDSLHPTGLNPCPFCGGIKVILDRAIISGADGPRTEYAVRCVGCGARTGTHSDVVTAVNVWNQRA